MKLSIVATLYESSPFIEEFCRRAAASANQLVGEDYEIILVNDGSSDNSLEIAVNLTLNNPHLLVVDLTRNFGHHKAILAGLETASGDYVFLIDSDLEESPELLIDFWEQMQRTNVELVNGQQVNRKGNLFERMSGAIYYSVYNFLSGTRIQPNLLMAKLMTKRFRDAILLHKERAFFLGGVLALVGFDVGYYECTKRLKGTTTYTLSRKLSQALNSIVSFSNRPLYYLVGVGMLILSLSVIAILTLAIRRLTVQSIPDGWTSLIIVVLAMSGLIIIAIGLVGVYVAKLFEEVKARPNYIIRKIYKADK